MDDYTYLWRTTALHLGIPTILVTDKPKEAPPDSGAGLFSVEVFAPKKWSTNDERIVAFLRVVTENPCEKVFLTDTGDVLFKKDPFPLVTESNRLCIGSEGPRHKTIEDSLWLARKLFLLNQKLPEDQKFLRDPVVEALLTWPAFTDLRGLPRRIINKLTRLLIARLAGREGSIWQNPLANAGVIGGFHRDVVKLLESMVATLQATGAHEWNLNMAILNYVLWRDKINFFSGPPLTNQFKSYWSAGPECIIHK